MSVSLSLLKSIHLSRIIVLLNIAAFGLISYSLVCLQKSPAKGYEISIYLATPKIFWLTIILSLLIGAFSLYINRMNRKFLISFFHIIFCNILLILLYVLRGYPLYFGRGDVSSYIGMSLDIIKYATVDLNNFYPHISILVSQIFLITSAPIMPISTFLPMIFLIIYMLGVYCWAKSIIQNKSFIACSIIASMPIFFPWYPLGMYHMMLAVWTLPIFFYLIQNNRDPRYRFLSIMMFFMYPFFHPIIAVFVLFYLFLFFIVPFFNKKKFNTSLQISRRTQLSIATSIFLTWVFYQYSLLKSFSTILRKLLGLINAPSSAAESMHYVSKLGAYNSVIVASLMLIDEIIFGILSLIAIYYLIRDKSIASLRDSLLPIASCFIFGNLLIIIIFFFTRAHNANRLLNLNPNMIIAPILVGFLMYYFIIKNQRMIHAILISVTLFLCITCIFSLYPSPITFAPNQQITFSDLAYNQWILSKKSPDISISGIFNPIYRFSDLYFGRSARLETYDIIVNDTTIGIKDHFGIDNATHYQINESQYLTIPAFDLAAYTEVWSFMNRFTYDDFAKISTIKNMLYIYDNGEAKIYFVRKGAGMLE